MAGAVRSKAYQNLLKDLVLHRQNQGFSQAELALRLGKPPSFVGKYELGERRLDIVELIVILKALDLNLMEVLKAIERDVPKQL